MMHRAAHRIERISRIILRTLLWGVFVFLVVSTILFFSYEDDMTANTADLDGKADAVLILGSSVQGNQLSQIVQDRVERAIEVYQQKKAEKILISGDGDNDDLYYDEVASIKKYLINRGIPPHIVFLDNAGYDTFDSIRRAKYMYGIESIVISTQRFHQPRALMIADSLGLDAQGIIADRTVYKSAERNALRESFARIKALGDIIFQNEAAINTGEKLDIHGNGNAYTTGSELVR